MKQSVTQGVQLLATLSRFHRILARVKSWAFVIAIACSLFGILVFLEGLRRRTRDGGGVKKAPRWMYIIVAGALQIPAILYVWFRFFRRS